MKSDAHPLATSLDPFTLDFARHRMAALAEIEMLQTMELRATLARIVDITEWLLPATGGASVILWNAQEESYYISVTTVPGQHAQTTADHVRRQGGATRWIIDQRRPLAVPSLQKDPFGANPILKQFGLEAYIGVPLLAGDEVLGVLYAMERQPRIHSKNDLDFLKVLAGRAASAIVNARLFEKVQQLAREDALTHLYNRRYFFERAEQEFTRARRFKHPLSVIMLDIDHFKSINDTYGHLVGDQVLKRVAELVHENQRANDLAGRYGGEEFALLLVETGAQAAQKIAQRLRALIAKTPFASDKGPITVQASLGVATLNNHTPDLYQLLDRADKALYAAKEAGRNQVCVG